MLPSMPPPRGRARGGLAGFLAGSPPSPNPPRPPAASPVDDAGLRALAAGFCRPDRPGAAAVRAALERLPAGASGRALWESLASDGAIPVSWLEGSGRGFAPEVWVQEATLAGDAYADPSLAEAAALAADPAGVAEAEAIAAEFVRRLAAFVPRSSQYAWWRARGRFDVAWQVTPFREVRAMPQSNVLPYVGDKLLQLPYERRSLSETIWKEIARVDALGRYVQEACPGRPALARVGQDVLHNVRTLAQNARIYALAQSEGWAVPSSWAKHLQGRLFADLPSPWEPLLWIYRRGYVLRGFVDVGLCPLLVAPPLDPADGCP